jgi:transcriptional regulator with GAF, ATPase, and Fis domain
LALAGNWRAGLAVPMLRDGKPVDAISVARAEPVPFSDRQIQLLTTFADQAVIAIENVRLFETEQQRTRELSEALEQQTATSEVLGVISSSPGVAGKLNFNLGRRARSGRWRPAFVALVVLVCLYFAVRNFMRARH